ncbi:MAG: aminotransferase class V-fold PLP-dependent enzyme [Acidimicrobiales bacterium]|nr:MAG: aminotransferase class V-fold PLP-dependent enzyme [Acidimicrobiales bacterium]
MHHYGPATNKLARAVMDYALARIRMDPPPLDGPRHADELERTAGPTITEDGIGGVEALRVFGDVLAPATISVDHPTYLSFVPAAPTETSILADLLVGASSIFGGTWLEGAGAVHAENEALDFIADLVGLPDSAGGVFVTGGTSGNLSALVAARHTAIAKRGRPPGRFSLIASRESHSSVASAAAVMDIDIVSAAIDDQRRLTGDAVRTALDGMSPEDREGVFAVVATAGTTNMGVVDDLVGLAEVCAENDLWFHVDGAYGGAALLSPRTRGLFDGVEHADSFIVDPHKWLFAPYDSCALLYRDPDLAAAAHTQKAGYLDVLEHERSPSDLAHHLTRRARGLPFWFSLATHGVKAYREAVESSLSLAEATRSIIADHEDLELLEPTGLSVVVFRRIGWDKSAYQEWSDRLLRQGLAFVTPTKVDGETVLRFCFINPRTTEHHVELILSTL